MSVSGGVARAGDFDNLDVPQIIPNAYKKATEKVEGGKKVGEVAKKLNEDAGNAIQGGAQEAESNINDKMKELMQAAGWTGPTLMVGQISGSIFDIFNATNSTVNLSKDEQEAWKSRGQVTKHLVKPSQTYEVNHGIDHQPSLVVVQLLMV